MKMCPGDCNWKMKMCDDGTCVLHWFESCAEKDYNQEDDEWGKEDKDEPDWDMSMPNIMPVDEPDMPVNEPECELYKRECEEGMCVGLMKMCPGDCHFGMKCKWRHVRLPLIRKLRQEGPRPRDGVGCGGD